MNISQYFDETEGRGILSTADADGKVDAALYARPYFKDENTVMFIMADRLTHKNLETNPWAVYLFIESGSTLSGKRLYLKKTGEEQNEQLVQQICRRCKIHQHQTGNHYLVTLNIEKVLPLVGPGN